MMSTNIILVIIAVMIFITGLFILGALAKIHAAIQVLTQIVAVAMQNANLVRTPEEVQEDTRTAEEEDLEAMKAETDLVL